MLRGWLTKLPVYFKRLRHSLPRRSVTPIPAAPLALASRRLDRIVMAEGVLRTLFSDYAEHRDSPRGNEEIGWFLLGYWEDGHVVAKAALPAGAERDASEGHVRFNTDAQAIASFMLRQHDKRLREIGVVHTHPGSMRYPSSGDLLGDSRWVEQLRSGEAVFGIGTADGAGEDADDAHTTGDVCFTWYALRAGESQYRPLPIETQSGADLGMPLRHAWHVIETHATPLLRIARQLARVQIDVVEEDLQTMLSVRIPLPMPRQQLRLLLSETEARYYWESEGKLNAIEPQEPLIDRAVYLILAELAKESPQRLREPRLLVES
jgi:proteasome lid subunit RPN8/RPN11